MSQNRLEGSIYNWLLFYSLAHAYSPELPPCSPSLDHRHRTLPIRAATLRGRDIPAFTPLCPCILHFLSTCSDRSSLEQPGL